MRIDSGSHRGTRLAVPEGKDIRPTSDRARQAIFNILAHGHDAIRDARVLDVFAGSGALGLEALSRGAVSLVAMERERIAADCIKKNAAACHETERTTILLGDATQPPPAHRYGKFAPCDLVFLDPPYGLDLVSPTLVALARAGWLAGNALVVAEMATRDAFSPPDGFSVIDERRYGKARVVMLRYEA
ncbi:16S rRNA (guanine966-N2)-methyltransferase [Dongia mobilis]|uniref:16S rRNA (Guanine966-N2)-methyltransferase n=1 Tax=Dongia mobilis TaxID=578943 RepID=A0A4R6WJ32_9PROT|nr:16S rRNA (guanine(966)-N(2))-methyltransferase RsmD [Dongia mobilis]TDQ78823.1 16S rRNA (guanine966-N2)-methyltransferase [Dongia mobilis]